MKNEFMKIQKEESHRRNHYHFDLNGICPRKNSSPYVWIKMKFVIMKFYNFEKLLRCKVTLINWFIGIIYWKRKHHVFVKEMDKSFCLMTMIVLLLHRTVMEYRWKSSSQRTAYSTNRILPEYQLLRRVVILQLISRYWIFIEEFIKWTYKSLC